MGNSSGVSRGDRNRNAKLAGLGALVPVSNTIVGIDLAGDTRWSWCVITTRRCWRAGRSGAGRGTWARRWTGPGNARPRGFAGETVGL